MYAPIAIRRKNPPFHDAALARMAEPGSFTVSVGGPAQCVSLSKHALQTVLDNSNMGQ
jgi:hypothetical protein